MGVEGFLHSPITQAHRALWVVRTRKGFIVEGNILELRMHWMAKVRDVWFCYSALLPLVSFRLRKSSFHHPPWSLSRSYIYSPAHSNSPLRPVLTHEPAHPQAWRRRYHDGGRRGRDSLINKSEPHCAFRVTISTAVLFGWGLEGCSAAVTYHTTRSSRQRYRGLRSRVSGLHAVELYQ